MGLGARFVSHAQASDLTADEKQFQSKLKQRSQKAAAAASAPKSVAAQPAESDSED